jgi:hypothetical protein
MSVLTSYARARAVQAGRAQRIATVRHLHLSASPMVFIPLKLAGEAAAPLAAMIGTDPANPHLLTVPQPRNRDLRFAFMAELAEILLPYIEGFGKEIEPDTDRFADAPQILVPNRGGIGFTRLVGRSTRFRRSDGPYPVHPSVPVLGRWLTFLAERSEFAGSAMLVSVTDVLAAHWASGQSPMEDANLAALLGWIDPPEDMTGVEAAAEAEDPLWSPPAGPDTDPGFDNQVLDPAIRAYDSSGSAAQVRDALRSRLEPTWRLMWRAVDLLRGLPEAAHAPARWRDDRFEFTGFTNRLAEGDHPQGRRDSAVGAAIRLERLEKAQERYDAQRAFDDPLVMAEHRMTGDAFAGRVVAAEPTRVIPSGRSRVLRPLITVETSDPVRLSPGDTLHSPSRPKQAAQVIEIAAGTVVLQLSGGMGRSLTPPSGSVPELGERVCYAGLTLDVRQGARFPAREDTPWTHGGPPAEYVPTDEDAQEAWS